jgi:transcriptional regulator with XRE-family HTH domain
MKKITFGELLFTRRIQQKISVSSLHGKTNFTNTYIYQLENERSKNPSFKIVLKLKQALKLSWEEIEACSNWDEPVYQERSTPLGALPYAPKPGGE